MAFCTITLVGGPPWGFRITDAENNKLCGPRVAQINPQSRAAKERLQIGDHLLTVNGRSVVGFSPCETQQIIRRASGILRLNVRRRSQTDDSGYSEKSKPSTVVVYQQPNRAQSVLAYGTHWINERAANTSAASRPTVVRNDQSSSSRGIGFANLLLPESSRNPLPSEAHFSASWNATMAGLSGGATRVLDGMRATKTTDSDRRWAPVRFTPMTSSTPSRGIPMTSGHRHHPHSDTKHRSDRRDTTPVLLPSDGDCRSIDVRSAPVTPTAEMLLRQQLDRQNPMDLRYLSPLRSPLLNRLRRRQHSGGSVEEDGSSPVVMRRSSSRTSDSDHRSSIPSARSSAQPITEEDTLKRCEEREPLLTPKADGGSRADSVVSSEEHFSLMTGSLEMLDGLLTTEDEAEEEGASSTTEPMTTAGDLRALAGESAAENTAADVSSFSAATGADVLSLMSTSNVSSHFDGYSFEKKLSPKSPQKNNIQDQHTNNINPTTDCPTNETKSSVPNGDALNMEIVKLANLIDSAPKDGNLRSNNPFDPCNNPITGPNSFDAPSNPALGVNSMMTSSAGDTSTPSSLSNHHHHPVQAPTFQADSYDFKPPAFWNTTATPRTTTLTDTTTQPPPPSYPPNIVHNSATMPDIPGYKSIVFAPPADRPFEYKRPPSQPLLPPTVDSGLSEYSLKKMTDGVGDYNSNNTAATMVHSPFAASFAATEKSAQLPANPTSASKPPPPPPPLPPPGTVPSYSIRLHESAKPTSTSNDPDRSVIEYPERQSVSSLRSTIQQKLSGSDPTGRGVGARRESGSSVTSDTAPVVQESPRFEAPPPPPVVSFTTGGAESNREEPIPGGSIFVGAVSSADAPASPQQSQFSAALAALTRGTNVIQQQAAGQNNYPISSTNPFVETHNTIPPSTAPQVQEQETAQVNAPLFARIRSGPPSNEASISNASHHHHQAQHQLPKQTSLPFAIDSYYQQQPQAQKATSVADRSDQWRGRILSGGDARETIGAESLPPPSPAAAYSQSDFRGGSLPRTTRTNGVGVPTPEWSTPYRPMATSYSFTGAQEGPGQRRKEKDPTDDFDMHKSWYKMMYRKLHDINKLEDHSVLKYRNQMNDLKNRRSKTPTIYHRSYSETGADLYNEPRTSTPVSMLTQQRTAQKLYNSGGANDSLFAMDYDKGYMPQPFNVSNMNRDLLGYERSMRSKSTGRYEDRYGRRTSSGSQPEIIRATTPQEQKYRNQPSRIENYVPGASSSLARYEQEQILLYKDGRFYRRKRTPTLEAQIDEDTAIVNKWIEERTQLKGTIAQRPRTSSVPSRSGLLDQQYGGNRYDLRGFEGDEFDSSGRRITNRGDLPPPSPDEVREWYRSIQHGGEVPLAGFRQPAPFRSDSFLKVAFQLVSNRTAPILLCRPTPSTAMGDQMLSSSRDEWFGARHGFNPLTAYQKPSLRGANRHSSYQARPLSPNRFAAERSRVADFHIPPFRWSRDRLAELNANSASGSDTSVRWRQIELYLQSQRQIFDEWYENSTKERQRMAKTVKYEHEMHRRRTEAEQDCAFEHACRILEESIRNISLSSAPPPSVLPPPTTQTVEPPAMQRSNSFPEGLSDSINADNSELTRPPAMKKSVSFSQPSTSRVLSSASLSLLAASVQEHRLTELLCRFRAAGLAQTRCAAQSRSLNAISEASTSSAHTWSFGDPLTAVSAKPRSRSLGEIWPAFGGKPAHIPRPPTSSGDDGTQRGLWQFRYRKLYSTEETDDFALSCSSIESSPRVDTNQRPLLRSKSAPAKLTRLAKVEKTKGRQSELTAHAYGYHSYLTDRASYPAATVANTGAPKISLFTTVPGCSYYHSETAYGRVGQPLYDFAANTNPCHAARYYQNVNPHEDSRLGTRSAMDMREGSITPVAPLSAADRAAMLDEERRKKFEQELEQERARRHGYLPTRSPGIASDRFDHLFDRYDPRSSKDNRCRSSLDHYSFSSTSDDYRRASSPVGVPMSGTATAIYPFAAHNNRELTLRKGDSIRLRRMVDQNWYEGELNGRIGIFPVNYVEVKLGPDADRTSTVSSAMKDHSTELGEAKVLYPFEARNANEISLKKGDWVTVMRRVDENWLEGRLSDGGRVGIFPSNYAQIVKEPTRTTAEVNHQLPFGDLLSGEEGKPSSTLFNDVSKPMPASCLKPSNRRHLVVFVDFLDAIVLDATTNNCRSVVDRSFRLGRRHAAILRGRTDNFSADWWHTFLCSMLEALVPRFEAWKATKALFAWHRLLSSVVETIVLGFLTGVVDSRQAKPMPTIFENENSIDFDNDQRQLLLSDTDEEEEEAETSTSVCTPDDTPLDSNGSAAHHPTTTYSNIDKRRKMPNCAASAGGAIGLGGLLYASLRRRFGFRTAATGKRAAVIIKSGVPLVPSRSDPLPRRCRSATKMLLENLRSLEDWDDLNV